MKTRRILAASTAALLAFGTTAIVSSAASATQEYRKVAVTWATNPTVTPSTTADQAKAFATAVKGENKDSDGEWGSEAAVATADYTVEATKTSAAWTVTIKPAEGVTGFGSISKSFSIAYDGAEADLGGSEGGSLDLGDGVTASVDKKGASKTFKDYNISAEAVVLDTVGSGDDATVDIDKTAVIKDLKDNLKDQFEDVSPNDIEIVNIELSSKNIVKSTAPGKVTIKVTTDFEPDYVYHVVDNEIEIITGAKSEKLTNDDGYVTTFSTTKFSPFILMKGDKLKGAGVTTEDKDPDAVNATSSAATSNASAATSNGAATTNPDTGIALAIAPVVLAAGAVAVVALKKKH